MLFPFFDIETIDSCVFNSVSIIYNYWLLYHLFLLYIWFWLLMTTDTLPSFFSGCHSLLLGGIFLVKKGYVYIVLRSLSSHD